MEANYLAQSIRIGEKTAQNRIAVLPTESNDAENNGMPSERTRMRYRKLAEGGAGIVFSEAMTVDYNARARKNQLLASAETERGLAELVSGMRKANPDTLIVFQLDHAGSLADPSCSEPVAVYARCGSAARVLSDAEIDRIRERFAEGAVVAERAGADGIELKLSHGFFGNEFLHPANTREGRYGGDFENRIRFFRTLMEDMKSRITSKTFLYGARISAYEGITGGFGTGGKDEVVEDLSEPVKFAVTAERLGLTLLSVSAGNAAANLDILMPTSRFPEAAYRHFGWTKAIKKAVSIPMIGAGYSFLANGANSLHACSPEQKSFLYWAEKNIADGNTDIVGIGRQAIADPYFPKKILSGNASSVNYCTACSGCGILLVSYTHAGCVVHNEYYKDLFAKLKK